MFVLVCGSANNGLCSTRLASNISDEYKLSENKSTNYFGDSSIGTAAFFGTGPANHPGDDFLLYVATTTYGRPSDKNPAAIATLELDRNIKSFDYLINDGISHSYIDVHQDIKGTFQAYYKYNFEHDDKIYMISVQMKDPKPELGVPTFISKIAQVCKNDLHYFSYTEFPLQCIKDSVDYNIVLSAHLNSGDSLMMEDNLYVTFGRGENLSSSTAHPVMGSALCVYKMADIMLTFDKIQQDCFQEQQATRVAWVYGKSINTARICTKDLTYDGNNFCGLQSNIGIQELVTSDLDMQRQRKVALFTVKDILLTTVKGIHQGGMSIAVLGTSNGRMYKVYANRTSIKLPYVDYDVTNDTYSPIASDSQLDKNQTSIYLLSKDKIHKIPLHTCSMHLTCEECVAGGDPLPCGWCVDKCTFQNECVKPTTAQGVLGNWSDKICPPVITKVTPKAGPLSGGSKVTITGRNFGSSGVGSVSVRIGGQLCKNITNMENSLTCHTPPSVSAVSAPVLVTVKDNAPGRRYLIDGTASGYNFEYKMPSFTDFSPKIGPLSGGTTLTVMGDNLDIGYKREIHVAGVLCPVLWLNSSQIMCETSKYVVKSDEKPRRRRAATSTGSDPIASGTVTLRIDGENLKSPGDFSYYNDSTITKIEPKTSIQSGFINLTITGTNLHIVAEPRIGATVEKRIGNRKYDKDINETWPCTVASNGKTMYCPSPDISSKFPDPISKGRSEIVYVWFIMDGIQRLREFKIEQFSVSRFIYHPDPKFNKFSGDDHIRVLMETEEVLDLHGENIVLGVTQNDLDISIGNSGCEVTLLKETVVYCKPKNRPTDVSDNEPRRKVEVKVGRLTYDIGELVYAASATKASLTTVVLIVIIILIIVGIVILVVLMRWKRLVCFKPPKDEMVRYRAGQEVQFGGLDSAGQRIFDLQNRENAYHEQRLSEGGANGAIGGDHIPPILLDDDTLLVLKDANLLIEREWLALGEILGRGHFGCVYKGYVTLPDSKEDDLVAVKTLHQNSPRDIDIQQFIDEAMRMKDFHHPNVLTLTGICFGMDEMPLVILPYMKHGDLLTYIRNEENNPTIKDLIMFGIDICKGMEYLSHLKVVHRDLACRNCMLDEEFHVKVADFGLSRDIYERDYYSSDNKKSKLPVKWMAPESLEKGTYSSKSDVWSYGVALWELMTRGVNPYPEVDNWDVLRFIKKNRRMPQPPFCPDHLYTVMKKCWEFAPGDRPSFSELVHEITDMITILEQQMKQGQESSNIQSTYVNVDKCTDYHYGDATEESRSRSSPKETANLDVLQTDV
ncbi:hypothetical protein FSP39_002266 [Pinctada imbricata]|uniref:receptor protein-tyrosine kinase n=1 Tax=Pinctada imbricata TaxID=66713 RepID=A0AA88YKD0_PINIB|nr:hypothetical protein FSP39_002266 [Pinctada imbricata]